MQQDFSFCQQRDNCKNLILFIHGFTGNSDNTWTNRNSSAFPHLLLENRYINENFDVASYSYFTTLLDLFATGKEKFRSIRNFLTGRSHKKEKNIDITELSSNLSNHFRITLNQYDNIYIVAHSMGGLITKSLISRNLEKEGSTKVKLFISLAVPHQGSDLSVLGGLISNNLQIQDLNPVKSLVNDLNQSWVTLSGIPTTKYFYGSYDEVVPKSSAVAIDKQKKDIISVAEDHSSICKPEDKNSITYNAVCQFIEEEHKHTCLKDAGYQKLSQVDEYDDQLFVIKLIVTNIAPETQENAKELFLNAEYMTRLFRSKHDKEELESLFTDIRQLYKDSYDNYLASPDINSGKLLAEVHTKITNENSNLLKSIIPTIKTYHKKGMLHQLANDHDSDIWWSRDRSLDNETGKS
ncbi:MAG: hypothetical protein RPS47_10170 [Colwellia sp.]|jgi:Putative serine esterase (DUF676).